MRKGMQVLAVVVVLVVGFMVQSAYAGQHVPCLKQVQVEVTSNLPAGWSQTPQIGSIVKKQISNIGGTPTLMCGYKVNNTTVFIQHAFPEGTKVCKPDAHGFMCN